MILTPFRWPGAKNKLLPVIMEYLNPLLKTSRYFYEPFVGGGAVMLEVASKYPNINIILNDKDEYVSAFWTIVAGSNKSDITDLINLLEQKPTIELFFSLRNRKASSLLEKAYYALFFNRTTFSGIFNSGPIGGKLQQSKYTVDCRYNFSKLKEKILACHDILKNRTSVGNANITDCELNQYNMTVYLDPPYIKAGPELYNESMSLAEHTKLASMLEQSHSQNWVLSYDDSPTVHDSYKFASIHSVNANYCINGAKIQWSKKSELIIVPKSR